MVILDAHLHFWSLATPGHEWPGPETPVLYGDFGPAELWAECGEALVEGGVLIQSQPGDEDTDWMLRQAQDDPFVQAVVGWADLERRDAPEKLAALAEHPKLRGLRPMLQAIEDSEWLLRPSLEPAIEAMIAHGLRLDALVQPRHLPMLARFVDRWPDLPVVIDHAAKPDIAGGGGYGWRRGLEALAGRGVFCKLSGLRTQQSPGQPAAALAPYVDHLVAAFADRLMWGSDWPVLRLSGDRYPDWLAEATALADAAGAKRDVLFGGSARRFYSLAEPARDTGRCA